MVVGYYPSNSTGSIRSPWDPRNAAEIVGGRAGAKAYDMTLSQSQRTQHIYNDTQNFMRNVLGLSKDGPTADAMARDLSMSGDNSLWGVFNRPTEHYNADAKQMLAYELGPGATQGWEDMPKAARDDLIRQMAIQRASRLSNRFTMLLNTLNEMMQTIIRNFKAG